MIYLAKVGRELSEKELSLFLELTDEERKTKIKKQGIGRRTTASLVGDVLVRLAIKKEYGINLKNINFSHEEKGKPYLSDYPSVHFNVSHSGDVVVCAVSDSPVGVDVEKIREVKENVKKKVCTEEEFEKLKLSSDEDAEFIKLWTMKEAVVKKRGSGIATSGFKTCLEGENVSSKRFEDYIISVLYQ